MARPTLASFVATRDALEKNSEELFAVVQDGAVKIEVNQTYPLEQAAQAHTDLEARQTTGATVLVPTST